MKRIQRIQTLNSLLQYHKGYTILELMAKLDVGERTLRKDLEKIQQPPFNAVFWNEYRGKERLYRYNDTSFSLSLFEERNDVQEKINEAIKSIECHGDDPQYMWLKLSLYAVENGNFAEENKIMTFENNADLEGLQHIDTLVNAISDRHPIKLKYKPYRKEERLIHVHPYHLKQYNSRWFLIGKPEDADMLHNYAIDRIVSIDHLAKPYIETDIDFDEYFDDVIGVSVPDAPVEKITIMVSKRRYPYIKTKPLHWSQKHIKEKDTDENVCIEIKVIPNQELTTLLLSYGPDLVVVEPQPLREQIANKVNEMYNSYKNYNGREND